MVTVQEDLCIGCAMCVNACPVGAVSLDPAYGCRFYDYWVPCGNAPAISCDAEEYYGMNAVVPDVCASFDDPVDPITEQAVDADVDGAIGEMVQTNFQREACPVVKYAYGDIVQLFLKECPGCGFKGRRIKVIGRADDMLIIKGVNVYPGTIKDIINEFIPDVTGEIRVVLEHPPPRVVAPLKPKIEHGKAMGRADLPHLAKRITTELYNRIRIRPVIEFVESGSLPKETRKTPLFEKKYDS
jgi:phenylacetate-CoA ligase